MPGSTPQFNAIDARVRGKFRIMPSSDDLPKISLGGEQRPVGYDELARSKLPEAVINFLIGMAGQLNYIAALLEKKTLDEEFPHTLDGCNISGSGIVFYAEQSLELGDYLEVLLTLNSLPLQMAGAIGKVIKKEHAPQGNKYTLKFTRISEPNLEAIVHFVFQVQRKSIREHHWI
jgi:hypothetical protein